MPKLSVEFDFNNLFAAGEHGLTDSDFAALAPRAEAAVRGVEKLHRAGELGFMDLPDQDCREIERMARDIAKRFDNFVVLGIGGSALGNQALYTALANPVSGVATTGAKRRGDKPRLFIADNSDPTLLADILDRCDLRKTLFNVISKSGGTVETAAQFLICGDAVCRKVGQKRAKDHFVITTDPKKGVLREIVELSGTRSLPIPSNVGGRFTALSSVGLLSSAVMGVNIRKLLAGAAKARAACQSAQLFENPALTAAAALYQLDQRGKKIHVLMPYAQKLRYVSDWFAQLWAESLGKKLDRSGRVVNVGPTPIKALGATDQHSQLQLFLEGPNDKVVIFLSVENLGAIGKIPKNLGEYDEFGYLGGKTLAELLRAEQRGTEIALTKNQRPNFNIRLDRVDEESVGALLFLLEMQTAYAGEFYNINAFDQPAVELGKQYACGIMGRKGYEKFAAEAKQAKRNEQYVVSI